MNHHALGQRTWMSLLAMALAMLAVAPGPQRGEAQDEKPKKNNKGRVALVIGNGAYGAGSQLKNPANDARLMKAVLEEAGFTVILVLDASLEEMELKLEEFRFKSTDAEAAWFFYAGHGLEVAGTNYLLPVNAALEQEYMVKHKTLSLDLVLDALAAADTPLKVVVLDCCRDNPFSKRWSRSAGSRGLGQVASTPAGTILAFAAAPGSTAADGEGNNSPFSDALAKALRTRGLGIQEVFQETGRLVLESTKETQRPWVNSDFYHKFIVLPELVKPKVEPPVVALPAPPKPETMVPVIKPEPSPPVTPPVPTPPVKPPEPPKPGTYDLFAGKKEGELRQVEYVPGQRMRFRWCPPGKFTQGSPATEKATLTGIGLSGTSIQDEVEREVTLTKGFWMSESEITQGQWAAVMGTGLLEQARLIIAEDPTLKEESAKGNPPDPELMFGPVQDDIPMYLVNHDEALAWCGKAADFIQSSSKGVQADWRPALPTEAQWEYACRAGTKTMTWLGDFQIQGANNAPGLGPIAWYGGNSSDGYAGRGWPVAAYPEKEVEGDSAGPRRVKTRTANPWGLHDMLGNLWEWTADRSASYAAEAVTDPTGPLLGEAFVMRGGSWTHPPANCRAAERVGHLPSQRHPYLGFRVVLIHDPAPKAAAKTQQP